MTSDPLILVVDDEVRFRANMLRLLGLSGLRALAAADGREALSIVDSLPVDVLLLDMKMPGMNGAEVMAELAKRPARPEVIFLSGHASLDLPLDAACQGACDYLIKPCTMDVLLAKIESAMERRRARRTGLGRPGPGT
ncbi:response regulator [Desulfocurvibacter africanus]|uniref:response regulator n=1 Tax=Desulfocurvibacter africanus TaxID=873 RepID=UPI002FDB0AD4